MTATQNANKRRLIDEVAVQTPEVIGHYYYGLFEHAGLSLAAAQQALVDKVVHRLAAQSEPRVLAGTAVRIGIHGPSANAFAAAARSAFAGRGLQHGAIEPFDLENAAAQSGVCAALEAFDVLVIEGSYCSIDQLALLSRARGALTPDGKLIVFSEYLNDDSEIRASALPNMSSFKQLAERLGFAIQAEEDLSDSAQLSIKAFTRLAASALPRNEALENLVEQLACIEQELASTRRSFNWIELARRSSAEGSGVEKGSTEYALAEYSDKSSFAPSAIAELFERSFEQSFDADVWQWKYEQGAGRCVVARAQACGDIVAHYGGAPRHISYFGKESLAIQPCDVMVMPEERTRYGHGSLFFKVAATFLEREIGNTVDHLLGFGFPNKKTMRLAIRLGLYEKTDDFVELRLPVSEPASAPATPDLVLASFDAEDGRQQGEIDTLWMSMRADFQEGIIGTRDWHYLNARYFKHPHRARYFFHWLRDAQGVAVALVVMKRSGEAWLVMDLVCAATQVRRVLKALNAALAQASQEKGEAARQVLLWLTQGWLSTALFEGVTVHDLGIEIPCNSWNPGPSAVTLAGKWWLTAGDMDFQ